MTAGSVQSVGSKNASVALAAMVEADGTARHRHARALQSPYAPMRDVSDALHIISMVHARFPGVLDHATAHGTPGVMLPWIETAAAAFTIERHWLSTLMATAGPLPSTPGHGECEAAVAAQRHALDTLSQSDRVGCAAGAAAALVLDWRAVRGVLDIAADRLGLDPAAFRLPGATDTARAIDAMAKTPAIERALAFGAQQFLAQQRGSWDLLEARAAARGTD